MAVALLAVSCTARGGSRPRPVPPGPIHGGRLVVAVADDAGILDPHLASEPSGFALIRATQRGLMAFPTVRAGTSSAKPSRPVPTPGATLPGNVASSSSPTAAASREADPVPDLAQSVGVSPDGRTYTFRLRSRIAFGPPALRALNANDVKAGLERALRLGTSVSAVLRTIQGAAAFEAGTQPTVSGIAATAADTVVIRLDRPANDLLWALAHPAASVVPAGTPAAVAPDALAASGPYRVERVRPGHEILLVRNGAWDRTSDPVRGAYVEQIQVVVGSGEGADIVGEGLTAPVGSETRSVPSPCLLLLFASPSHPRFASQNVRSGISLAIDRTQLIRVASAAAPEIAGRPAATLLPPGSTGAILTRAIPAGNPEHARALIGSGAAVPLARESTGPDGRADEAVGAALEDMLAAAGLATTPMRPLPPGSIYELYEARAAPLGVGRWCADWPGRNGRSMIGALVGTGGAANWSATSDAVLDSQIATATTQQDPTRIAAAWRIAEARARALATVIPLAFLDEQVPISGRLRGFEGHPLYLRGDLTGVWLDPRGRASPAPAVAAGPR